MKLRSVIATSTLITFSLFSSTTFATLIHPNYVSASAGYSLPSSQFIGSSQESFTDSIFDLYAPHIVTAIDGPRHAQTGIGFANAGGSLEAYGALKLQTHFVINDLSLSYVGTGVAGDTVRGSFKSSYSAWLGDGLANGNSSLYSALKISGQSDRSILKTGSAINTTGAWEEWFNFTVGSTFNLSFATNLLIASAWIPLPADPGGRVGVYRAEGGYSTVLGGSPVFNLPGGYQINSADGSIVNNYFIGNMADITPVPIPATLFLLMIGLLGLAVVNVRNQRNKLSQCL